MFLFRVTCQVLGIRVGSCTLETQLFKWFGAQAVGRVCALSRTGVEANDCLAQLQATVLAHLLGDDTMAHLAGMLFIVSQLRVR